MTSRAFLAALGVLALTTSGCISTSSTTEVRDGVAQPGPPIAIDEPAPDPGVDGGDGEAILVEPHDGEVQGSTAVAWDRVAYRRDEGVIDVYWWSGVEPCTVLDRVEVEVLDDEVVVTVFEGAPPEAATISCVAMAVYKQARVTLDEDLGDRRITDGAA